MSGAPGARRTIVKVCGLTSARDARAALEAGADWLGFIVAATSPRALAPERAAEIVATLGGGTAVAVMADVTPEQALAHARAAGASRVQLHRVDPAAWPADFPLPCAFAASVDAAGALHGALPAAPHLLLLDTAHRTLAGGTGETFPWAAARELAAARAVMLAGGRRQRRRRDRGRAAVRSGCVVPARARARNQGPRQSAAFRRRGEGVR